LIDWLESIFLFWVFHTWPLINFSEKFIWAFNYENKFFISHNFIANWMVSHFLQECFFLLFWEIFGKLTLECVVSFASFFCSNPSYWRETRQHSCSISRTQTRTPYCSKNFDFQQEIDKYKIHHQNLQNDIQKLNSQILSFSSEKANYEQKINELTFNST
jgi:hypothetical protein